eukprot:scaffold5929_cov72-Phaeocystis_antarctica.AAC.2
MAAAMEAGVVMGSFSEHLAHSGGHGRRLLTRQGCEKRRPPQQMTHSEFRSQLLGKRPSSAPLCEVYVTLVLASPHKPRQNPTLALTLALEVALLRTTRGIVGHVQRVPAEPAMHAAHGPLLVGYGLTPLGVGGYGLAVRTRRPQPRLRWRGVKEYREQHGVVPLPSCTTTLASDKLVTACCGGSACTAGVISRELALSSTVFSILVSSRVLSLTQASSASEPGREVSHFQIL